MNVYIPPTHIRIHSYYLLGGLFPFASESFPLHISGILCCYELLFWELNMMNLNFNNSEKPLLKLGLFHSLSWAHSNFVNDFQLFS